MALYDYLKQLSEANGPSGFEHEVAKAAQTMLTPFGTTYVDALLNVYTERDGNTGDRLTVMLDAHLDEVGLIVHSVCPNGLLRVQPLGSWIPASIPSHRFRIKTDGGEWIPALAASKPPHYMTEAERAAGVDFPSIRLDIGATSKDEVLARGIHVASPVVPDTACICDEATGTMIGKAFDCRIGCAALIETIQRLDGESLDCDITAVLSTQEEVGGRGAKVATRAVEPDLAIVFEGTPADDTFGSPDEQQTKLSQGPMLRHIDRSMITHPGFQRFALDLARDRGIPVQEGVRAGGGTNGGIIHTEGMGIPTIVLGVPVRYIHTCYGIAKQTDLEATVDLAATLLTALDEAAWTRLMRYGLE